MRHKILVCLLPLFCLLIAQTALSSVKNGLVLYLPFDGDTKDLSDNKATVELKGKENWTAGKYGKAFEFDGTTHLEVVDEKDKTFDGISGLTIALWVNLNEHHDNGIVVKLTSGSYWPCSYNLETWSDQLVYFDVGSDAGKYATAKYPLGKWFHVVGLFDGDKGEDRVYIDGKLESTNPRTEKVVPDGVHPVCIGAVRANDLNFRGALDDLVIYNRALTDTEIKSVMQSNILSVDKAEKLSTTWSEIKK